MSIEWRCSLFILCGTLRVDTARVMVSASRPCVHSSSRLVYASLNACRTTLRPRDRPMPRRPIAARCTRSDSRDGHGSGATTVSRRHRASVGHDARCARRFQRFVSRPSRSRRLLYRARREDRFQPRERDCRRAERRDGDAGFPAACSRAGAHRHHRDIAATRRNRGGRAAAPIGRAEHRDGVAWRRHPRAAKCKRGRGGGTDARRDDGARRG